MRTGTCVIKVKDKIRYYREIVLILFEQDVCNFLGIKKSV